MLRTRRARTLAPLGAGRGDGEAPVHDTIISRPARRRFPGRVRIALMLLTFGHGTATAGQMSELLRGAGVTVLVDVRTAPGSRRHPHLARAELERWLPQAGLSYRWEKRLGGFRKAAPDSPDIAWREDMFRGYAAHMRTAGFGSAVDEVLAQAEADPTAVVCAESLWWR